MMKLVLPDPGIAPDAHRLDLLHRRGKIGDTRHGFARVRVAVHKPDAGSNIHVILNHDLLVDQENNVVADVNTVAKYEPGFIALASAEDIDLAKEIDVIPDYYACVSDDQGMRQTRKRLPTGDTPTAKTAVRKGSSSSPTAGPARTRAER